MKRSKRKRLERLAQEAALTSGVELVHAQDIAYARFLIAEENCMRNYYDVYRVTLDDLLSQGEKNEDDAQ